MTAMLEWAKDELARAGYPETDNNDINDWMRENVLELLEVFAKQGHSGSSAPYAVALFEKLAMWKPIAPLTGEDDEWNDPIEAGNDLYQNKRNSSVFKNGKDGEAYWIHGKIFYHWISDPDIDEGKPYKLTFTTKGSSVPVIFPWTEPEPVYVEVVIDSNGEVMRDESGYPIEVKK